MTAILEGLRDWVKRNQNIETGLLFGLSVKEPTNQQEVKGYNFSLDTEPVSLFIAVWETGEVFLSRADLSKGPNASDEEVFHDESFEFANAESLVRMLETFIKENVPQPN